MVYGPVAGGRAGGGYIGRRRRTARGGKNLARGTGGAAWGSVGGRVADLGAQIPTFPSRSAERPRDHLARQADRG
eukprot:scaffold39010_cov25-Tisochrysis_lutea.AAC.1